MNKLILQKDRAYYELLQDLPDVDKGAIFGETTNGDEVFLTMSDDEWIERAKEKRRAPEYRMSIKVVERNPSWFRLIQEPEKKTRLRDAVAKMLPEFEKQLEEDAKLITEAVHDVACIARCNGENAAIDLIQKQFVVINRQDLEEQKTRI